MKPIFAEAALTILTLTACAPMIDTHGNAADPDRLAALQVDKTPYTEVMTLLGSPSARTMFDTENWLYIESKQKRKAFFKPEEFEREVVMLKFDRKGILRGIERKTLADGRALTPDGTITATTAKEFGVIDQIAGNVGRFSTEQAVH